MRPYGPGEEQGRVHGDEAGEGPCQSRKGCQGQKGMWPLAGVFEEDLATLGAGVPPTGIGEAVRTTRKEAGVTFFLTTQVLGSWCQVGG